MNHPALPWPPVMGPAARFFAGTEEPQHQPRPEIQATAPKETKLTVLCLVKHGFICFPASFSQKEDKSQACLQSRFRKFCLLLPWSTHKFRVGQKTHQSSEHFGSSSHTAWLCCVPDTGSFAAADLPHLNPLSSFPTESSGEEWIAEGV